MREVIMRLTPKPFEDAEYAEIVQDLVRCGECKYLFRTGRRGICLNDHDGGFNTLTDDWYCADGERREDD